MKSTDTRSFTSWARSFRKLGKEVSVYNTDTSHVIRISSYFKRHFDGTKFVRLLYDKKNRRFAIKPLHKHERDSFLITKDSKSEALDISPLAFLRKLKIPHGRHSAIWDEKSSMLVISIRTSPS
ncbi:MAG: hypothetical protein IH932_04845 [Thaumarchaeota archaeon]|nr:hypothetical protein [Nitrososphaerota archaeon]